MILLIQNTQNRDGPTLQAKLDEPSCSSDADDEFMGIEKLTDAELEVLHMRYRAAADSSQRAVERTAREMAASRRRENTSRKT